MAPNLTSGKFRVISLIDDSDGNPLDPVGVNLTRPAFQSVHLNGRVTTVRQTQGSPHCLYWVVEQEGDNTYRLSVGGYPYTGVIDNNVTASTHAEQNVEWIATYREFQDAYTISPIDDKFVAWTANDDTEVFMSQITLRPIIFVPVFPPKFIPAQLFRFEAVNE
ncbi:hypothetical protein EV363DRAFT_1189684 [Boletus edulis]|nr:hypothetical protein EV363DRAFT_1189684 [Boletus edulis]